MKDIVPIMSIKLVMLPDSVYPLHIFEDKYLNLISYCKSQSTAFGIVAIIENKISEIGCMVEISEIRDEYRDGSLDIIVKGKNRFRIIDTHLSESGYLEARTECFDDLDENSPALPFAEKTISLLKSILKKTGLTLDEGYWNNLSKSKFKSFKLAEKSGLSIEQRQKILEMETEIERIEYIYKHLTSVENLIKKDKLIKQLIAGDGYLN